MSLTPEQREQQTRYARDSWITVCVAGVVIGALVAYFIKGVDVRPAVARASRYERVCPDTDIRLNAYERELQQRECEARQRQR